MKKLLIVLVLLFLSISLFGSSCNEFLIRADESIVKSENTPWVNKMQERSTRAIMYMMRYNICKQIKDNNGTM